MLKQVLATTLLVTALAAMEAPKDTAAAATSPAAHEAKKEGHKAKKEGHEAKKEGHEAKKEEHKAKKEGHEAKKEHEKGAVATAPAAAPVVVDAPVVAAK